MRKPPGRVAPARAGSPGRFPGGGEQDLRHAEVAVVGEEFGQRVAGAGASLVFGHLTSRRAATRSRIRPATDRLRSPFDAFGRGRGGEEDDLVLVGVEADAGPRDVVRDEEVDALVRRASVPRSRGGRCVSAAKPTRTAVRRAAPAAARRMSGVATSPNAGTPAARLIFSGAGDSTAKSAGAAAISRTSADAISARTASRISDARSTLTTRTPGGEARDTGPLTRTTSPPRAARPRARARSPSSPSCGSRGIGPGRPARAWVRPSRGRGARRANARRRPPRGSPSRSGRASARRPGPTSPQARSPASGSTTVAPRAFRIARFSSVAGMRPHPRVHRGREDDRPAVPERVRREDVVADAPGHLREHVGRGRRHGEDVGPARERHVVDRPGGGIPEVGDRPGSSRGRRG